MARVKLSEFRAKTMLIDDYQGVALHLDTLDDDIKNLATDTSYVIKVDQGVKKRGKQGLLKLNVTKDQANSAVKELADKGYTRFIAEKMLPHEDNEEHYLSLERTRDGISISYSPNGGIDIEDSPETIKATIYPEALETIPKEIIDKIVTTMDEQHLSFVEINPIVIQGTSVTFLDSAVLADSAGEYFASKWGEKDVVDARKKTPEELSVEELNDNTPSALSLRVLNPDGALWLVLNGGGASITIADEAHNHGKGKLIGDYGEFSGGPGPEESYLYVREIISLMMKSKAPKKALIVAGTVANFTDVVKTFSGTIRAIDEVADQMKADGIDVFVRRGGPNEKEGLAKMEKFLKENGIFGSIVGSEGVITEAIDKGLMYVAEGEKQ